MTEPRIDLEKDAEEIIALGRMISFACQRARSLNLEFSTYCLDMALTSIIQDITDAGASFPSADQSFADLSRKSIN